jgi:mycothiol system anti-sigma-R factor
MKCDESLEILYRFIDKDLDGMTCEEIEFHLKSCHHCWDRFEFEKKLKEHVHKTCHKEVPEETLLLRIKKLLDHY